MTTQSEQILEQNLITQLTAMKYEPVTIRNERDLLANLKTQLEKHNQATYSEPEFAKILNHLSKGNIYDRSKTLRDRMALQRDDGSTVFVDFFNSRDWCQNQYQVTNQVTMEGSYKNRYDVTILINGLPLVQVELKRRGMELKEAYNQVARYHRHSYSAGQGLFQFVQLFVISNGVNTKYYANNPKQSFKFTSYWTTKDNSKISDLSEFTNIFLDRCHISKMIARYIVLAETKTLMALRPYQYYAVESIVDKVQNSKSGGYIWHTTGSGKTLTSFKASQIICDLPDIYKVVFVVDRNDLDTQTIKEFNSFQEDSVDQTDNTRTLVKQFGNPDNRLIVTTIQKLNNAISHGRHLPHMDEHKDKKIVFIFDECHRSQFGEIHKRITEYFTNRQLFGFTGTPIFTDNASGPVAIRRTTHDLFGECLHRYVITDAINDENVLKFSVEYVGRYRRKDTRNETDIEVEAIDTKELMESPERLSKIVDYILANHNRKTHAREFTAIFAAPSIDVLAKYYDLFKLKQAGVENQLKVATIFTFGANESPAEGDDLLNTENDLQLSLGSVNQHSRDKLEGYIADYNAIFGTNYTTRDSQSFYNYYRDIATRVKDGKIDLLLVVNMFLTGFDSKRLNTLYVDKNLRYHGLIQAYSRTNRIGNDRKSQGNIVAFRNLKHDTDKALELFSNKDANEVIFMKPYEDYAEQFQVVYDKLAEHTPTPSSVDALQGESEQAEFVQLFRELLRLLNTLTSFTDFSYGDLPLSQQDIEGFKSKYLDLHDKVRQETEKEKVSILEDIDFELELVRRDDINVDYIVGLLARMVDGSEEENAKLTQNIFATMNNAPALRSKRELIEKFIKGTVPHLDEDDDVRVAFDSFWSEEKQKALTDLCQSEVVDPARVQQFIDDYLYSNRKPRRDDLATALTSQPSVLERASILQRLSGRLNEFFEKFIDGV